MFFEILVGSSTLMSRILWFGHRGRPSQSWSLSIEDLRKVWDMLKEFDYSKAQLNSAKAGVLDSVRKLSVSTDTVIFRIIYLRIYDVYEFGTLKKDEE